MPILSLQVFSLFSHCCGGTGYAWWCFRAVGRVQMIKTALCLPAFFFFFLPPPSVFPFRLGEPVLLVELYTHTHTRTHAQAHTYTVRPPEGDIYNWEEVQRQISASYSHCTCSPSPHWCFQAFLIGSKRRWKGTRRRRAIL